MRSFSALDSKYERGRCLSHVGTEGPVLEGPERADGGDVAALGAEKSVKIQTLDVVQLDLHGFV